MSRMQTQTHITLCNPIHALMVILLSVPMLLCTSCSYQLNLQTKDTFHQALHTCNYEVMVTQCDVVCVCISEHIHACIYTSSTVPSARMCSEGYGTVCLCLSVSPLMRNSPLKHLFVLKTIPHTQWTTKVKIFVAWNYYVQKLLCETRAKKPIC